MIKKIILGLGIFLQSTFVIAQTPSDPLRFNPQAYTIKTLSFQGNQFQVRAYENISYVQKPLSAEYQVLNIYIPIKYYEAQTINGYTANTAPIFFPNTIGGYMPAKPLTLGLNTPSKTNKDMNEKPMMMPPMHDSASLMALQQGFVVVSAGARGRTLQNEKGEYIGKAPAAIVDLKAAIRYLHYNDTLIPGDANKIISNGTSAGGALSALLGASGNHSDYEPYLKELGAADAKDTLFAVSAYCPITNLEHADMAYEWLLSPITHYKKLVLSQMIDWNMKREETEGELSTFEQAISSKLKALFPSYINSLELTREDGALLTLNKDGGGSFREYVQSFVIASAQKALDKGTNLSSFAWINQKNAHVYSIDFDQYLQHMGRMKTPPAFDALDISSGENSLFGTPSLNAQHFTSFSQENDTAKGTLANPLMVKMMNPMEYIVAPQKATISKYWRIRHGTIDKDTSLAISVILATKLRNSGFDVDFELPWDKPHSGDYDLDELFAWANKISH